MDLKIKDVAELLSISETTVRRWLSEGKIPAYRLNRQYRFSRAEIEDWLLQKKMNNSSPVSNSGSGSMQFSLYRSLCRGQLYEEAPCTSKEEVIGWTMEKMAAKFDLDPLVLTDLFLDRERMMSTALGSGIAVPHTRDFLLNTHYDVMTVVFLKEPIEYGALDGQPVHTLFFLFASEDKMHLHLLAKLAHLCSNKEARQFISTQPSRQAFLDYVKLLETKIDF